MNPRNDQAALDSQFGHTGDDCNDCGPSWWGKRGCFVQAKENYADPKRRVVFGHTYKEVTLENPATGYTAKEHVEK